MNTKNPYFEIKTDGNWIKIVPNISDNSFDGMWVTSYVDIKAGAFSAKYNAHFTKADFGQFRKELQYLYGHLNSTARFDGPEDYLKLTLKGDGMGHIEVYCVASDNVGYQQSEFCFYLNIDQTFIPVLIRQLDEIIESFNRN